MEALFSREKMDPHAQNVMMTTRTKGQSVGTRSKQGKDDNEPVSIKKEENTQQKLSSQRAWHVPKNHVILCSPCAVNKNYELRRSTRMYGVHAAAVQSASGKETRVQTRVMQKKKSIENAIESSVRSADNCCEYKIIMEVKNLQTEIRNPG